jgi:hypothetical protein
VKNWSDLWVEKQASSLETKLRDLQDYAEQLCRYLRLVNSAQHLPENCREWSRKMLRDAEAADAVISYCSIQILLRQRRSNPT